MKVKLQRKYFSFMSGGFRWTKALPFVRNERGSVVHEVIAGYTTRDGCDIVKYRCGNGGRGPGLRLADSIEALLTHGFVPCEFCRMRARQQKRRGLAAEAAAAID